MKLVGDCLALMLVVRGGQKQIGVSCPFVLCKNLKPECESSTRKQKENKFAQNVFEI